MTQIYIQKHIELIETTNFAIETVINVNLKPSKEDNVKLAALHFTF